MKIIISENQVYYCDIIITQPMLRLQIKYESFVLLVKDKLLLEKS